MEEAQPLKARESQIEIGESGTYRVGGFISGEEYNFKLIGRAALDVWEQMRRNDGDCCTDR
jgi:hypothetical protein